MLITEKLRNEILFALPKLTTKEAEKIRKKCNVSKDTVYRQYRRLKSDNPAFDNPVIIELAELAASKRSDVIKTHKRVQLIEKQFSQKPAA